MLTINIIEKLAVPLSGVILKINITTPKKINNKFSGDGVDAFEARFIQQALEEHRGNWAAAARELDMNRSDLHNLATRLGIRHKKSADHG